MQTDRHIEELRQADRLIKRQTEKFNRHTQRRNPHAYADPGKTGAQSPPPPPPTPVKSHNYTPKIQTIFTLMLTRATKAIKWSFAGGPMTARFSVIWILPPLIK